MLVCPIENKEKSPASSGEEIGEGNTDWRCLSTYVRTYAIEKLCL